MSTVYIPRTIESVRQADALPSGTFIRLSIMSDSWTRLLAPEDRDPHDEDEVPFLALVPVQAEEERVDVTRICDPGERTRTRYVTPWEDA